MVTKSRSVIAWGWGEIRERRRDSPSGTKKVWGGLETFIILVVLMASRVYIPMSKHSQLYSYIRNMCSLLYVCYRKSEKFNKQLNKVLSKK